jgi:hypothetical protein
LYLTQDLQTAVVQITLQLQTDADHVSSLTNRVAQIIRDRDEVKKKEDFYLIINIEI